MPTEWIIEEGHYEYKLNEVERSINEVSDFLYLIKYGEDRISRTCKGKKVWRDTVRGIKIPINIISSKIIIQGEPVKPMDVKIVAPSDAWTLEKRGADGVRVAEIALNPMNKAGERVAQGLQTREMHTRQVGNNRRQPTVNVDVYVEGVKLSGEIGKVTDNGKLRSVRTPIRWAVKAGGRYGGNEVVFVRNGKRYQGKLQRFMVDWDNTRTVAVVLEEKRENKGASK